MLHTVIIITFIIMHSGKTMLIIGLSGKMFCYSLLDYYSNIIFLESCNIEQQSSSSKQFDPVLLEQGLYGTNKYIDSNDLSI